MLVTHNYVTAWFATKQTYKVRKVHKVGLSKYMNKRYALFKTNLPNRSEYLEVEGRGWAFPAATTKMLAILLPALIKF